VDLMATHDCTEGRHESRRRNEAVICKTRLQKQILELLLLRRQRGQMLSNYIGFSPALEDFDRDDVLESASHHCAPASRIQENVARNAKEEFNKFTIKIGVAILTPD
jgi:hypothetical protein